MAEGLATVLSIANTLLMSINNILQVKEISSIFSYKSDLEDLKQIVSSSKALLLDAADKRNLITRNEQSFIDELIMKNQQHYVDKVKDVIYDADDLFDKFVTLIELNQELSLRDGDRFKKVHHLFSSKNPLIVAWSISRGVKKIRKNFDDIVKHFSQVHLQDHSYVSQHFGRIDIEGETHPYAEADSIIGREDDAREIIDRLLNSTDDDVGFLTIVGMGGLGKTTLAQLVFNDESIESEFPLRSWICVADQDERFDVKKILSNILSTFGFESDNLNNFEYIVKVYAQNIRGKKFLLVLDDVWTEDHGNWHELRRFLMMGGKGSRIIATTRSKKTAAIIGNDTYELKGLSDEDSRHLFQMMAFGGQSIPPDFVEISQNIVKTCSNLPLAIKVVGCLLFGETIQKFRSLLENIDGFAGVPSEHNPTIMTILKLSYDHLQPSLKSCFSYCAIFPKDSIIMKDVLMNLWEAQGYIAPFEDSQSIENAGEEHFATLLQRCFFQNVKMNEYGYVESVKMHDLMHDLAQRVSGNEICVINSSPPKAKYNARHIFDCTVIKEDDFIIQSKIRSYLMFQKRWSFETGNESTPLPLSKIVNKPLCLRALALQGLRLGSLPDTMGKLLHLRYLNLAKNSMKRLPDSIVNLHNLQTLNLNKCDELKEWPKDFSKLVKLKHLYREKCYELRYMPVGMSKLTRVRVLTDFVVKDESVGGMRRVGQLKDLKALSVNIQTRLSVQFHVNFKSSKKYDWEGGCLEGAKYLKEVEIGFSFPSNVLYQRRLDEERVSNEEVVMTKLQPHPNLRKFILSHYSGNMIPRWGRAQDNWAEASYLPNLIHIKLSNCHRLQQLPVLSKLLHLKSLYLFDLKILKYAEEEEISSSGSESSEPRLLDTAFFPSLESLEILELKKLRGWWRPCFGRHRQIAFSRLCQLTIKNCPDLTSLPLCPSHTKVELREINKKLRIRRSDEAEASSSFHPTHPILSCP